MHPGQRNSLDALCKRYNVDNSNREFHGALLDARILLDVYLAMTGGQSAFALGVSAARGESVQGNQVAPLRAPGMKLCVPIATDDEVKRHEAMLDLLVKASGGKVLWRDGAPAEDGTHGNH